MKTENIQFENDKGLALSGRLYTGVETPSVCVVYSHGLFSSKDAYKINRIAGDIVKKGFGLLTFDFSFSGDNIDKVSQMSLLQEVADLRSAAGYVLGRGFSSVILMGSSMGGVVSLLFAADHGEVPVDSLLLIATPVFLTEILADAHRLNIDNLPEDGYTTVDGISLTNRFFKELKNIPITDAIGRITVPVLILHGALDAVVHVNNAYMLERLLRADKKLVIIDDGDHNLTRESDIEIIRSNTLQWLTRGY